MVTKAIEARLEKLGTVMETNELEQEAARRLGITDDKLLQDHPEVIAARNALTDGGVSSIKTAAIVGGISGLALATAPVIFAERMAKSKVARGIVGASTALGAAVAVGGAYLASAAYKGSRNMERELRLENKALMDEIRHTPDGMKVLAQVEAETASKAGESFAASVPQRGASYTQQATFEASQPSTKTLAS